MKGLLWNHVSFSWYMFDKSPAPAAHLRWVKLMAHNFRWISPNHSPLLTVQPRALSFITVMLDWYFKMNFINPKKFLFGSLKLFDFLLSPQLPLFIKNFFLFLWKVNNFDLPAYSMGLYTEHNFSVNEFWQPWKRDIKICQLDFQMFLDVMCTLNRQPAILRYIY